MTITYEVCTAYGRPIKTFDTRKAATASAGENAEVFPDLQVFEVTHQAPVRRRIWRDRARLTLVAS